MSIKEFWEEEPDLIWTYRKMYMDKIKIQQEQDNFNCWINGLYIFDAITIALYNSFGRKETQPAKNYMEKPIDFNNIKSKEEIEKEKMLEVEEQIKERNRKIKQMLKNKYNK